jgi:uncharacterized protein DUF1207
MRRLLLWVAVGALSVPAAAASQATDRWFPEDSYFPRPTAAPREPTFALRGIWTDVFVGRLSSAERPAFDFDEAPADLETDAQGEAALGGSVRLWRLAEFADGGISLGVSGAVFGRFRLEVSSSDLVASDWIVALPVEGRWGEWSGRARLLHWSAHLGDEMIEKTGAERIDFTHNGVDLLVARQLGGARLYGGGALLSRSSLENEEQLPVGFSDDASVQLGVDGVWTGWLDGRMGLEGGLDVQMADRTDWDAQWSVVAGTVIRDGPRTVRLRGTFFDGPSPMGQFFLTHERYWGFELEIEL